MRSRSKEAVSHQRASSQTGHRMEELQSVPALATSAIRNRSRRKLSGQGTRCNSPVSALGAVTWICIIEKAARIIQP